MAHTRSQAVFGQVLQRGGRVGWRLLLVEGDYTWSKFCVKAFETLANK